MSGKRAIAIASIGLLAMGAAGFGFRLARHNPHPPPAAPLDVAGDATPAASPVPTSPQLSLLATGDVWGEVEPCG